MRLWPIGLVILTLATARAETPGPVGQPTGPWREQIHWVPAQDGGGRTRLLYTRICRPAGDRPARVVLINHGKPADADVSKVKPAACGNEAVQWFLARGYLVVAGVRRGYGETGGDLAETSGSCSADALVRAAHEGARDVDALLRYATSLPYAQPDRVVVVGQSVGGWVTDGYDSVPHPHVAAMVSMAGGHGGHIHGIPNNNCRPDQLVLAAGVLGRTATTPMLWIYTANDSFFDPGLAQRMYDAFTGSGGRAEFHPLPPFARDGHTLFFGNGGSAIWGPLVEAYLGRMADR
nr:CocE/NonD family hydrolase [uncultured Rhodopila sp.]